MCPSVCRVLYTAWYSIGESTDVVYNVYGMFAMLLVCISALVGTWSVRNQVLACRGVSIYVSICLSCILHGLVQYRRVYRCDLLCVWDYRNASFVYLCSGWDMDGSESGVGVQRSVRLCVHLFVVYSTRPGTVSASLPM